LANCRQQLSPQHTVCCYFNQEYNITLLFNKLNGEFESQGYKYVTPFLTN